jgi:hypothetical protein
MRVKTFKVVSTTFVTKLPGGSSVDANRPCGIDEA